MQLLRASGRRAGLFRPRTLFPFPRKQIARLASGSRKLAVVELSNGQMADDVELAAGGRIPVLRFNWFWGIVPTAAELAQRIQEEIDD
jgi:pyruvate/2-oxoacid:ferredoxin oxidoreductase alpha subunit